MRSIRVMVSATVTFSIAASVALAGKPPPPPTSSATVFYSQVALGNNWFSMNTNGGSKTTLAGTRGIGMSRVKYAGSFVTVQLAPNGGVYPNGEAAQNLRVQPVNSTSYVTLLTGTRFHLSGNTFASFVPDHPTQLSFTALEWDPSAVWDGVAWSPAPRAGFFVVDLSLGSDGSITGAAGDPAMVLPMGPPETDSAPSRRGDMLRFDCRSAFDWVGSTKIAWASVRMATNIREIRISDLSDPGRSYVVIGGPTAWGAVAVNPSRTRVCYGDYRGLVETNLDGSGAFVWQDFVAWSTSPKHQKGHTPSDPQYVDDDTLIYTYQVFDGSLSTPADVYKATRGGSKTNLTSDLSTSSANGFVR